MNEPIKDLQEFVSHSLNDMGVTCSGAARSTGEIALALWMADLLKESSVLSLSHLYKKIVEVSGRDMSVACVKSRVARFYNSCCISMPSEQKYIIFGTADLSSIEMSVGIFLTKVSEYLIDLKAEDEERKLSCRDNAVTKAMQELLPRIAGTIEGAVVCNFLCKMIKVDGTLHPFSINMLDGRHYENRLKEDIYAFKKRTFLELDKARLKQIFKKRTRLNTMSIEAFMNAVAKYVAEKVCEDHLM